MNMRRPVALKIGLDLGVISPVLFAMMVIMAVRTTLMTSPLLSLFARGSAQPTNASSASLS